MGDIAGSIDQAAYVTLPKGVPDGVMDYMYVFEFVDAVNGQPLLSHGGTPYRTTSGFMPAYLDPLPVKNVFTLYLVTQKGWGETPFFIKKGEDFHEIQAKVLYAD